MRIALYSRPRATYLAEDLILLIETLKGHAMSIQINKDFAAQITELTGIPFEPEQLYTDSSGIRSHTDVMICYGGDGTFLGGVRLLENLPIPIIGINSGRLGFLANVSKENMDAALADLSRGNYDVQERTLLYIEGDFIEQSRYPYAFNELTIQRQNANMISTEVYVNGEMIATCHGDGVLISTPAGSTAYSLSVGGPVVAPDCNCFVISPIAPHNLTMRPVVVPDTSLVTFKVATRGDDFSVSLDNRNYSAKNNASFCVSKAKKSIFLVHLQNISFYDTLRNKMMWGIDNRNGQK